MFHEICADFRRAPCRLQVFRAGYSEWGFWGVWFCACFKKQPHEPTVVRGAVLEALWEADTPRWEVAKAELFELLNWRDEEYRELYDSMVLDAPCPECGALSGSMCSHKTTGRPIKKMHSGRYRRIRWSGPSRLEQCFTVVAYERRFSWEENTVRTDPYYQTFWASNFTSAGPDY